MSMLQEILADIKAALFSPAGPEPPATGDPAATAPRPPVESEQVAPEQTSEPPATGHPAEAVHQPPARPDATLVRRRPWYLFAGAVAVLAALLAVGFLVGAGRTLQAPGKEVLATYTRPGVAGEQEVFITRDELRVYLAGLPAEPPASVEGYRSALVTLVVDRLLWEGLLARTGPESLERAVADVIYERYPVSLFDDVIAAIPISDSQVREYYESHQGQWDGRALSEVRQEILASLRQGKAPAAIANYVAGLRARVTIVEHPDVMAVPEPSEAAMEKYYQDRIGELTPPRQAKVDMLRFRQQGPARQLAAEARAQLEQGADLETLGETYGRYATTGVDALLIEGQRKDEFDEIVFDLQAGELSPVIDDGDAYYIVLVKETHHEPAPEYEDVRDEIRALLWIEAADEWFQARQDDPLFEMGGHRYLAGDFFAAFKAQEQGARAAYHSAQSFAELVDRTIDWLLVVDDVRRQGYPPEGKGGGSYERLALLERVTGMEEIDLSVDDAEIYDYYEKHSHEFVIPTRFDVRYLAIETGNTDAEKSLAWNRAQEAYDRLRQMSRSPDEVEFLEVAAAFVENPRSGIPSGWIAAATPQELESVDAGEEMMAHPLYDLLLDLQADDLAGPLEVDGTVYVVQVLQREDEHLLDLYGATNVLKEKFALERTRAAVDELGQMLLDQANFVVYENNLRSVLWSE